MGVLNLTPDSLFRWWVFYSIGDATAQIDKLIKDGADIVDIGAESSRPGSNEVSASEEWSRLEPILSILDRWPETTFSLDSYKEETIKKALDYRVDMINNIKGLVSKELLKEVSSKGRSYVSMHIHGNPKNMQDTPLSGLEQSLEVIKSLEQDFLVLKECGFSSDKIFLDPGIGFGKDDSANLILLKLSMEKASIIPLLVGISRKSFIGRLLGIDNPLERDAPSKMLEICLMMSGVKIIRTHEVKTLSKMRELIFT